MAHKTAQAGAPAKKAKRSEFSGMSRALVRRETISAYLFLLPSLIFFVGFVLVPMGICLVYSFLKYGLSGVEGFAGFSNYIRMFQDTVFIKGFWNTVLIVVVSVPAVTAFSLWVGSAIYPMRAGLRSFFRCVFYMPVVTGTVLSALADIVPSGDPMVFPCSPKLISRKYPLPRDIESRRSDR